jgi:PhoH-like ATPase
LSKYRNKNFNPTEIFFNQDQKELVRLMNENNKPIIFCNGDAGTGKTFTMVATALKLVMVQKKYRYIYYLREPIEVGKSLGFLPGDLDDKFGIYLGGLKDNLEHIADATGWNINDITEKIESIPPQFVRGRSFEDAIILVDEAQNLSLDSIQMLATRLGKYCKIIFAGSMNQIDVKSFSKESNDFKRAQEILKDCDFVGSVTLTESERSIYAKEIDELFTKSKREP